MSDIDAFATVLVFVIPVLCVVWPIVGECLYLIFGDDDED